MKHSDWIGIRVKAASTIQMDDKRTIPAGTVMRVLAAKHCRLTVVEDVPKPSFEIEGVSMGAVEILGRAA